LRKATRGFREVRIASGWIVLQIPIFHHSLLQDIHRFVQKERDKSFLKSLFNKDRRINQIESFYRHIGLIVNAFHVSPVIPCCCQDSVMMPELDLEPAEHAGYVQEQ
jgi:hypothetical protein